MPVLGLLFHPLDDIRIRSSQILFFGRIIFKIIQPDGYRIPHVDNLVSRGVFSCIANQKLPIVFNTPEILQRRSSRCRGSPDRQPEERRRLREVLPVEDTETFGSWDGATF